MPRRKRIDPDQQPETDVEAAPVRRRRHDPGKSVTDGDYRQDKVHGCLPGTNIVRIPGSRYDGMRVALVDPNTEDMAKYLHRGAVEVERGELSPRPEFDMGSKDAAGYSVKGLKLMALTEEQWDKAQRPARAVAEQRRKTLRKDSLRRGQFASVSEEEYSRQYV